jgi:cytochrome oxidase assembly protein ShyY1
MAVCAVLAQWQWDRAELRAAANERVRTASETLPVDAILPAGATLDEADRWTLVEATGEYDAGAELVLRARSHDGANGFEIVTPLVLDDGTALLVNRGFVPGTASTAPDYPAAPAGTVTVVGRVFESEPAGGDVTVENGLLQARRLNLERLADHYGYGLRGAWVAELEPAEGFSAPPTPSFRSWQNYSYAVQWALFAALVPVGWTVLLRREMRGDDDPEPALSTPIEADEN